MIKRNILESIIKIIAYGFLFGKNAYLLDPWSRLDFFIVVASIVDLTITNENTNFIKMIKIIRVLRPLRFLTHFENL